jgi:dipeptidase
MSTTTLSFRFGTFFFTLLLALLFLKASGVEGKCTAIGIGKDATVDGTIMVAHTDDAGNDASDLRLVRVPAKDHAPEAVRPVYRFRDGFPRLVDESRSPEYGAMAGGSEAQEKSKPLGYIKEVNHTYAYWDQEYGMMNEHQLTIGESTCGARTVAFPLDNEAKNGKALFGIEELSKVALERCVTARCAIQTMGDLGMEFGFYAEEDRADSGEALVLGDKEELWVFHILPSPSGAQAIWAAQRVPDDHTVVVANDFVIQQMDLSDKAGDNFMYSSNMLRIASKRGWWNGEEEFNFFQVFGFEPKRFDPVLGLYSGRRMWRFNSLINAEYNATANPYTGYIPSQCSAYPPFTKPDNKISLERLFDILADHYEGTAFDLTKGSAAGPFGNPNRFEGHQKGEKYLKGGFERPISIYRGTFSFVLQSSSEIPDFLGGVAWYGQDQPSGSVYVPIYGGMESLATGYQWPKQSEFSLDSTWWAFNFVNNWMQLGYNKMLEDVLSAKYKLQKEAIKLHQLVIESTRVIPSESVAKKLSSEMSQKFMDYVGREWWSLAFKLIAKYSNGLVTTGEGPGQRKAPGYPNWWLKEVGYTDWPPNGENLDTNKHHLQAIS